MFARTRATRRPSIQRTSLGPSPSSTSATAESGIGRPYRQSTSVWNITLTMA